MITIIIWIIPAPCLRIFMSRVAHGAELGDEEVVATMVRRRVLLDVGKLHKLKKNNNNKKHKTLKDPV